MKKLLLGIGSVAAVTVPVALVISCGKKDEVRHFNASYDEAKSNEVTIIGSGITRVSSVSAETTYTMSSNNAREIVQRIMQLGFDIYKSITKVKISIEGYNIDGENLKTIPVTLGVRLNDEMIKKLTKQFATLIIT